MRKRTAAAGPGLKPGRAALGYLALGYLALGRLTLGRLVLGCLVLAGCSMPTDGWAVPADTAGPRPVAASALHRALLDNGMVDDIMGASGMTVQDSTTRLFDDGSQFPDDECMIGWSPVEQSVYAHTGWTAMLAETLLETPGDSDHFVIQGVVRFPSRDDARDFFTEATRKWMRCGDRTFTVRRDGGDSTWVFGGVSSADSTLWMTQTQTAGPGWSCQRALRVANNVSIDVLACKFYVSDEAVTIAQAIDERLPSV